MKITCNNCEEVIQGYLCDLPSEWRKQIASVICRFLNPATTINCSDVKKCETLTTLSSFQVNGSNVCIDYTDEDGVLWHRCFDIAQIGLTLDPKCIMSQSAWDLLTWQEQLQAIIDYKCDCGVGGSRCHCYTVHNNESGVGLVPYVIKYVDCDYNTQSISSVEGQTDSFCAITNSIVSNFNDTITDNGVCGVDCPPLG